MRQNSPSPKHTQKRCHIVEIGIVTTHPDRLRSRYETGNDAGAASALGTKSPATQDGEPISGRRTCLGEFLAPVPGLQSSPGAPCRFGGGTLLLCLRRGCTPNRPAGRHRNAPIGRCTHLPLLRSCKWGNGIANLHERTGAVLASRICGGRTRLHPRRPHRWEQPGGSLHPSTKRSDPLSPPRSGLIEQDGGRVG
jgi:hypothetical protein